MLPAFLPKEILRCVLTQELRRVIITPSTPDGRQEESGMTLEQAIESIALAPWWEGVKREVEAMIADAQRGAA